MHGMILVHEQLLSRREEILRREDKTKSARPAFVMFEQTDRLAVGHSTNHVVP